MSLFMNSYLVAMSAVYTHHPLFHSRTVHKLRRGDWGICVYWSVGCCVYICMFLREEQFKGEGGGGISFQPDEYKSPYVGPAIVAKSTEGVCLGNVAVQLFREVAV
jgi:hypothetical protein